MHPSTFSAATLCLAATVLLAGCSQSNPQSVPQSENKADNELSAPTAKVAEGPLDKYLNIAAETKESAADTIVREGKQREEIIAACMSAEGFEYTPTTDYLLQAELMSSSAAGPTAFTLDYAQQYGYGIASSPSADPSEAEITADNYVDPNADYVDSLSDSEREAYLDTLAGKALTEAELEAEANGEYESTWEDRGCTGKAYHDVGSAPSPWDDPDYSDLLNAIHDLHTALPAAPEMKALESEWASCMSEAGFGGLTASDEPMLAFHEEYAQLTQGQDDESVTPSAEAVTALHTKEVETAVADWKCRDSVNYEETEQKIRFAAEQKFLDEHQEKLEAMLAKYSMQSS